MNQFARTELLVGAEGIEKLKKAHVAVFGIGGVGGYVVEALARSGVGTLDLIDNDRVSLTNLNRQIIATHSTIGEYKVDVAKRRCWTFIRWQWYIHTRPFSCLKRRQNLILAHMIM